MEQWRQVVGFEGLYEVSDDGRVRSVASGRLKAQVLNKRDGRRYVMLWKAGRQKVGKIHRLVLLAFVGPPPPGHEGCHNNGDALDNRLGNLRWDTPSANQRDRVKHGTSNRGERCAAAKLTESQARAIKADPRLHRIIAEEYGVRQNTVSRIKSGKRWPHL